MEQVKGFLGKTDMYLIDLLQKGYFDDSGSVIDVGSGSGRNLKFFCDLGWLVMAIDENPDVFFNEVYKVKKLSISTGVGELGRLDHGLGKFDFVLCNAVLHFAKDLEQFKSMVEDLIRLQKKGGVIFCRFVSSETLDFPKEKMNMVQILLDGTERFVVDYDWLISDYLPGLNVAFLEAPKTISVDGLRSMTTLVLNAE